MIHPTISIVKTTILINFSDFDPGFDKKNNYFYYILSKHYNIIISETNPQYLIYSCFGTDFLNFNCVKIFYSGENDPPDFNLCDYALSCHSIIFHDRHKRFPNFLTYSQHQELLSDRIALSLDDVKNKKFGNFIVSSTWAHPLRVNFYQLLSNYKHIDSPGKVFNNMEIPTSYSQWDHEKINFIRNYKFTIAFENSSVPGYTTEKIMHAFIGRSIPIYWGNPLVSLDFNSEAFINCHDYESIEEVIEKVKEVDNNDLLYLEMINKPSFNMNKFPEYLEEDYILSFFQNIFQQPYEKAFRRTLYGFSGKYTEVYNQRVKDASAYVTATSSLKETAKFVKDQLVKRFY